MEYKNPFFSESILCHYVDLPQTTYVSDSFVNTYRYDDPKKEAQIRFESSQNGRGMTFGGAKIKAGVLLLVFSISYTASWYLNQMFGHQMAVVFSALALSLFLALWMVNRPEHSSFLGPSFAMLYGIFGGGISRIFSPGMGEALLYLAGIPICVLITMMFVVTQGMCDHKHKLKTIVVGSMFSTSLLYFYVILAEYVFRVPMHFPLAMESGFILLVLFCLLGAIYCFRSDLEVLDLSITYGAPKNVEWYYAFAIFATIAWFYVAGIIFIVQCALESD